MAKYMQSNLIISISSVYAYLTELTAQNRLPPYKCISYTHNLDICLKTRIRMIHFQQGLTSSVTREMLSIEMWTPASYRQQRSDSSP